jgi:hypothetical protein
MRKHKIGRRKVNDQVVHVAELYYVGCKEPSIIGPYETIEEVIREVDAEKQKYADMTIDTSA